VEPFQAIMMAVKPFAPLPSNSATFNRAIPTLLQAYLVSLIVYRFYLSPLSQAIESL
jgi:hypothetical protein